VVHKLILLCLFTALAEPKCFASSVATPRGYKIAAVPAQPTSSRMISYRLPASFPVAEKNER
jgi:hypothetical protein